MDKESEPNQNPSNPTAENPPQDWLKQSDLENNPNDNTMNSFIDQNLKAEFNDQESSLNVEKYQSPKSPSMNKSSTQNSKTIEHSNLDRTSEKGNIDDTPEGLDSNSNEINLKTPKSKRKPGT